MLYGEIQEAASNAGLLVMGAVHEEHATLILLGAADQFWPVFTTSPEAQDGAKDPIDRWSRRVITKIAQRFDAEAEFPFTGPPYAPFIQWALDSGRAFSSPTGMLVHDEVGLMISYRGALRLPDVIPVPEANAASPCDSCEDKPCTTACPVGALASDHPYDVAGCHAYLDTAPGQDCMTAGCLARRACPFSHGRAAEQSALHMRAFHPT